MRPAHIAPLLIPLSILLMGACDQDRFLSGQWIIAPEEDGTEPGRDMEPLFACDPTDDVANPVDEDSGQQGCTKWLELNLGHFGEDVVGSLRFFDTAARLQQTICTETTRCSCGYVQGRFANDKLILTHRDCTGDRVVETTIRVVSSSELQWELPGETVKLVPSDRPVTGLDKECKTKLVLGEAGLCTEATAP